MLTQKDLPPNQIRLIRELGDSAVFLALAERLKADERVQPMKKLTKEGLSADSIAMNYARASGYEAGVVAVLNLLEGKS